MRLVFVLFVPSPHFLGLHLKIFNFGFSCTKLRKGIVLDFKFYFYTPFCTPFCTPFVPHLGYIVFVPHFGVHKKPVSPSLTNKFTSAPSFVPQMYLKFVPHLRYLRYIVFVPYLVHENDPIYSLVSSMMV